MPDKPCPDCGGTGMQIVERFSRRLGYAVSGAGPCHCAKGRALKEVQDERDTPANPNVQPVVSTDSAAFATEALGAIPFFPGDEVPRAMIANEIRKLCRSEEDVLWLVERMIRLYTRWPGVVDMRLVYCARRRPLDGIYPTLVSSETYPDGIPAEFPAPEPTPLLLPPGHAASADLQLEAAVSELAAAKRLPPEGRPFPAAIPTPKIAETPAQKCFKPITQADIDREVAALRERRANEAARKEAGLA